MREKYDLENGPGGVPTLIRDKFRWVIGLANQVLVCYVLWMLPRWSLHYAGIYINEVILDDKVDSAHFKWRMGLISNGEWDYVGCQRVLTERRLPWSAMLHWPRKGVHAYIVWTRSTSSLYSVREVFPVLMWKRSQSTGRRFSQLSDTQRAMFLSYPKLLVHPKSLFFLWEMLHESLPPSVLLWYRGISSSAVCVHSGGTNESSDHISSLDDIFSLIGVLKSRTKLVSKVCLLVFGYTLWPLKGTDWFFIWGIRHLILRWFGAPFRHLHWTNKQTHPSIWKGSNMEMGITHNLQFSTLEPQRPVLHWVKSLPLPHTH